MNPSETQRFAWVKRFGMPVLYYDPMPELGAYINQRAMFRAWPRPVRWMPSNWIIVPAVMICEFAAMAISALKQAKGGDA